MGSDKIQGRKHGIIEKSICVCYKKSHFHRGGNKAQPLDEGKLLLQSEAGEVFYKDIRIKEIGGIPEQYRHYFAE
ncbi:hypothetical protein Barb4_02517 [Bacteroidales bacterium Barb4]|nr:hypothetical protein Barb4_02517 [Bacteroidales bacterium Barb4]